MLFFTRGVSTVIFIEGGYKPAPERKMIKLLIFDIKLVSVIVTLGTLRSEDGDGSENVAEKVNSLSFNLYRDYSKSLTLSNVGEPS